MAATSALAPRQSTTAIAVGTHIVDDAGNPVGDVVSIEGSDVVVRTDRHEARIPRSSLWVNRGRVILSMTRAQLNAAVERLAPPPPVQAQSQPVQLAPGIVVRGSGGAIAGTIEAVAQDNITLRLTSGQSVSIPRSAVAATAEGGVISITAEELRRRAEQAIPAASQ
jgi:preprotein translocase subunit YajC